MSLLEAIILGLIQGTSEFLPVSSSGHLLVFHHLFGITAEDNLTFIIVLNMGSLIPLLFVFRKDIWGLIKNPFQKMTALLIIATIPLIIVTLLFEDFIESMFHGIYFLPVGFVITGVVLLLSDRLKNNPKDMTGIRFVDAVLIGIAQAVAVFPGISRSGSTLSATIARGVNRESAAKFSFLMSVPAAVGAMVFRFSRVIADPELLEGLNVVNLGAGFITAAITGYFAINIMLTIIKRAKLKYFALYYIFALAILVGFLFLRA
ncbi:MAG: undecaprenyl-diphosphate phosphatase [Defluviitaleaceae bacterium]|nr:undecaprenyl-diphosphate phosphatase [Defluviitaleaceae bacterium]